MPDHGLAGVAEAVDCVVIFVDRNRQYVARESVALDKQVAGDQAEILGEVVGAGVPGTSKRPRDTRT